MQFITVVMLSLVCIAQAGLLGGIVPRDEFDDPKSSSDSPSQPVGLLSGVGGIPNDDEKPDKAEEDPSLLLAGIGGISTKTKKHGASQLALRDSFGKEEDEGDDGDNNAAETQVGSPSNLPND